MSDSTEKNIPIFAGFWIRIAADIFDAVILAIFAFGFGSLFENFCLRLGEYGAWLGLLVSVLYYVGFQSYLGGGQSIGKRILGIQVLGLDGHPLPLAKSLLRYFVIAGLASSDVFAGISKLIVTPTSSAIASSIMTALWTVAFVACYLIMICHPFKRGLHDLVAGSIVVFKNRFDRSLLMGIDFQSQSKKTAVFGGFAVVVVLAFGVWSLLETVRDQSLEKLGLELANNRTFQAISVIDETNHSEEGSSRLLFVEARVEGPLSQTKAELKERYDLVFQAIRSNVGDLSNYDQLRVGLRTGYNLGIGKRYVTQFLYEKPNAPGERHEAGTNLRF